MDEKIYIRINRSSSLSVHSKIFIRTLYRGAGILSIIPYIIQEELLVKYAYAHDNLEIARKRKEERRALYE